METWKREMTGPQLISMELSGRLWTETDRFSDWSSESTLQRRSWSSMTPGWREFSQVSLNVIWKVSVKGETAANTDTHRLLSQVLRIRLYAGWTVLIFNSWTGKKEKSKHLYAWTELVYMDTVGWRQSLGLFLFAHTGSIWDVRDASKLRWGKMGSNFCSSNLTSINSCEHWPALLGRSERDPWFLLSFPLSFPTQRRATHSYACEHCTSLSAPPPANTVRGGEKKLNSNRSDYFWLIWHS